MRWRDFIDQDGKSISRFCSQECFLVSIPAVSGSKDVDESQDDSLNALSGRTDAHSRS